MDCSEYLKLFSLNKTLTIRLKPQYGTEETIARNHIIESDFEKSQKYRDGKRLLDNAYKSFINAALSHVANKGDFHKLFSSLAEALNQYNQDKSNSEVRKKLVSCQQACRAFVVKCMKEEEGFDALAKGNGKDMLDKVFSQIDDPTLATTFHGFGGYFNGYFINRANLFSSQHIAVSVANRAVDENFSKFFANCQIYQEIKKNYPDLYEEIAQAVNPPEGFPSLDDVFTIDQYPCFVSQNGIDQFNLLLGGRSSKVTVVKDQGINEKINLYCQHHGEVKKGRLLMSRLYKQILFDRNTFSFVDAKYTTENEMATDIASALQGTPMEGLYIMLNRISHVLDSQFDQSSVYMMHSRLSHISQEVFGSWRIVGDALQAWKERDLQKSGVTITTSNARKKVEQFLKSDFIDVKTLKDALDSYTSDDGKRYSLSAVFESLPKKIAVLQENVRVLLQLIERKDFAFKEHESQLQLLKLTLDSMQACVSFVRTFIPPESYRIDQSFYDVFQDNDDTETMLRLYNRVRNFMTQKHAEQEKYKLTFNSGSLGNGWDVNKEQEYLCMLFLKKENGKTFYYLGIWNKNCKKGERVIAESADTERCFLKMRYKLLPSPNKMLPKVFFSAKNRDLFPAPPCVTATYTRKKNKEENYWSPDFSSQLDFERALIKYYEDNIGKYADWKNFSFQMRKPEEYANLNEFFSDLEQNSYFLEFVPVSEKSIRQLVEEGKLYFFQIYNKDFAPGATGAKNLHTLLWEQVFDPENLRDVCIKLNGQAELFYRPKAAGKTSVHPVGSKMVNRTCNDGTTLPDDVHKEIFEYVNGHIPTLSDEALIWFSKAVVKDVTHEIVKDRRYYQNEYFIHVPVTMNVHASKRNVDLNNLVRLDLHDDFSVNIIGIDRGERNLVYISVIDPKGRILEQRSLNVVPGQRGNVDYQEKLTQREIARDAARKSWKEIGAIKELKEGYLSQIVHIVASLMVKYNAIVVLEDLNMGFKRSRCKFERQVYQKFESMLITKLNYLVFKDVDPRSPGGILNAFQLTDPFQSFEKLGRQSGWLFYVPASYTSKIDPVTGFADLFDTRDLTSFEKKQHFFSLFDRIWVNEQRHVCFSFDYKKFQTKIKYRNSCWAVEAFGTRIKHEKNKEWVTVDLDTAFEAVFRQFDKAYAIGVDVKAELQKCTRSDIKFMDAFYRLFRLTVQLRNSNPKTQEDYILSPVKGEDGSWYDSRNYTCQSPLPCDADANGAYNIARKGLLYVRKLQMSAQPEKEKLSLSGDEWFSYVTRS